MLGTGTKDSTEVPTNASGATSGAWSRLSATRPLVGAVQDSAHCPSRSESYKSRNLRILIIPSWQLPFSYFFHRGKARSPFSVAQIVNLLFRRLAIGRTLAEFTASGQGAILQDGILRYSRLAVCATNPAEALTTYKARCNLEAFL